MITTQDDLKREMLAIASGKVARVALEDALVKHILTLPGPVLAQLPPPVHALIERFVDRAGITGDNPAAALAGAQSYFAKNPVDTQLAGRIHRAFGQLAIANRPDDRARKARAFLGG